MTHEDYVTYEQAVKLKELGFDWKCYTFYHWDNWCGLSHSGIYENHNMFKKCISAPTLSQAQKWLREKGIDITPIPVTRDDERKYRWALDRLNPRLRDWTDDIINNYEEALSAGIDRALQLLTDKTEKK